MEKSIEDRIRVIIEEENMTPSAFAETLGVGRANISHILSGRNNASLEIVTKILDSFSYINPSWLLFGRGNMSLDEKTSKETPKNNIGVYPDLFNYDDVDDSFEGAATSSSENRIEETTNPSVLHSANVSSSIKIESKSKEITKIIVYYSDNSFQIFNPSSEHF